MLGTAPSAITRSVYAISCSPTSVCHGDRRAPSSRATARPRTRSACGHIIRSGTTAWRGSSVPEAASGSSGVYSMKLSVLTIVAPRDGAAARPSCRRTPRRERASRHEHTPSELHRPLLPSSWHEVNPGCGRGLRGGVSRAGTRGGGSRPAARRARLRARVRRSRGRHGGVRAGRQGSRRHHDRRAARRVPTWRRTEWIDHAVATGIGHARNLAVVASGDAMIAVGGEWGTASEVAFARKLGRPVVLLGRGPAIEGRGSTGRRLLPRPWSLRCRWPTPESVNSRGRPFTSPHRACGAAGSALPPCRAAR